MAVMAPNPQEELPEDAKQAAEWQAFHERAAAAGVLINQQAIDEDVWINALSALEGVSGPVSDAKPMAVLLRSEKQIPPGVRDALAEMLAPGNPSFMRMCLRAEPLQTLRKEQEHGAKLQATLQYNRCIADGMGASAALEEARKIHGFEDDSAFYRTRRTMNAFWRKFIGRLRGG